MSEFWAFWLTSGVAGYYAAKRYCKEEDIKYTNMVALVLVGAALVLGPLLLVVTGLALLTPQIRGFTSLTKQDVLDWLNQRSKF